jgi:signal peptidase II
MEPTRRLVRLAWFAAATAIGGGCDLQSKSWAEHALAGRPGQAIMVADPWLELSLAYNRGTAFSFVTDLGDARWLFAILALVLVVVFAIGLFRAPHGRAHILALGAIAGGALGNGLDRALDLGRAGETGVVDFIKVNYPWGGSWPTFNVADILIVVGVAVLLIDGWRKRGSAPAPAPAT